MWQKLVIYFTLDCPVPLCYLNKTPQKEVINLILINIVQDTTVAHAEDTICFLQASCKGVHLDYLLPCSRVGSSNTTAADMYIAQNKSSTDILLKSVIFCRVQNCQFSHFQTEDWTPCAGLCMEWVARLLSRSCSACTCISAHAAAACELGLTSPISSGGAHFQLQRCW